MTNALNDVLSMSKIEDGAMRLELRLISVRTLVEASVQVCVRIQYNNTNPVPHLLILSSFLNIDSVPHLIISSHYTNIVKVQFFSPPTNVIPITHTGGPRTS